MVIFKDIPVSTQTFTVKTNMFFTVDLEHLFNKMNLDEFIISIKYKTQTKGEFKKKKTKKKTNSKKNFLNCITVVILFDKKINVKVFKNGVFQLTGCKNLHHAKQSIYYILQHISKCDYMIHLWLKVIIVDAYLMSYVILNQPCAILILN